MPLPHTDTTVSFPAGTLTDRAVVQSVTAGDGQALVLTDRTPFHPVDPHWPDQGPDLGSIGRGGTRVAVRDCLVGATDGAVLYVGDTVPVPRGEPGWAFVVVHVVDLGVVPLAEGDEVTLVVDPARRAALSARHTGCHLAAPALNAALAGRWRKTPRLDSLGHPDFDQTAIASSGIEPYGSIDRYRLGRSLRRGGFDPGGLADELPALTEAVNRTLAGWVADGGTVWVDARRPGLGSRREWVCELPAGTARMPCGGTHVHGLGELGSIRVTLALAADGQLLTMRTAVGDG